MFSLQYKSDIFFTYVFMVGEGEIELKRDVLL